MSLCSITIGLINIRAPQNTEPQADILRGILLGIWLFFLFLSFCSYLLICLLLFLGGQNFSGHNIFAYKLKSKYFAPKISNRLK